MYRRFILWSSIFFASIFLVATGGSAQDYSLVSAGSSVRFTITNTIVIKMNVEGSFTGLTGVARFNPKDLSSANMEASVKAKTIRTGNKSRDEHLHKAEYFDVANHPNIIIKSSSIQKGAGANEYIFKGKLTMKGKTKDLQFPFTMQRASSGILLKGSFMVDRLFFGIGPDNSIGKEATVTVTALGIEK